MNHLWWREEFTPLNGGDEFGYVSKDGRTVVGVKNATGIRGLYSVAMQLALALSDKPEIKRACLVLRLSRLSLGRVRREWMKIKAVLHPEAAQGLSLVAIGQGDAWVEPDEEFLHRIANVFQVTSGETPDTTPVLIKSHPKQKHLEVLKVLLHRWLLREGAIPIGKLAEQVGCAYSTVKEALEKLQQRRSITRQVNRSVELAKFPISSWNELLALSGSMRRSFRYRDVSGEKSDPEQLLKRLERMKPSSVALGGVVAARHWHSEFDLHGIPRLDLLLHAPENTADLSFVRKLDPALKLTEDYDAPATLVVRPLQRSAPLFDVVSGKSLPFADPVETTLDLYDLGLTAQAGQLLAYFRPEIRLP
ncbi:MAG: hypothetical protein WCJ35_23455 [Planctomycetota bacterium]